MVTGHVEKRYGFWRIILELDKIDGKRQRTPTKTKFATKTAAKKARDKLVAQLDGSKVLQSGTPTVAEFFAEHFQDESPRWTSRTFDNYTRLFRCHVVPHLGKLLIGQLEDDHIQRLYTALQRQLSPRTVTIIRFILRGGLKKAVRRRLLPRDPTEDIKIAKVRRKERRWFTDTEAERFLVAIRGHRDADLYGFALATGLRRQELLALRWSDINLASKVLTVNRGFAKLAGVLEIIPPKTEASHRIVPLGDASTTTVDRVRKAQDERKRIMKGKYQDNGLVFCNPDGSYIDPSALTHRFNAAIKPFAPGMRFYDLRHSFASILYERGVDPETLKDLLGHSNIRTVLDTYVHIHRARHTQAVAVFDEILPWGNEWASKPSSLENSKPAQP